MDRHYGEAKMESPVRSNLAGPRPEKRSIEGLSNMTCASTNCILEELANLMARLECTPTAVDNSNTKPISTIEANLELAIAHSERSLHIIQALKAKLFN